MYKIEFTLKQHTPIIHFQHDQDGATLRASEVKPKLDRFLINYCTINQIQINDEWKQDWDDNKKALRYKVQIKLKGDSFIELDECRGWGAFFGEMGAENQGKYKMSFVNGFLSLEITSFFDFLLEIILQNICDFFSEGGFGTRQSKGYGIFYPEESSKSFIGNNYYKPVSKSYLFDFNSKGKTWKEIGKELFSHIDFFYRSLRSGINIKESPKFLKSDLNSDGIDEFLNISKSSFYFKSILFSYLHSLGIQWDKKTIKENLFNKKYFLRFPDSRERQSLVRMGFPDNGRIWERGFTKQKELFPNEGILYMESEEHILSLWRDLFGLSSEESWKNYGKATLTKTQAKQNSAGNWVKVRKDDNKVIQRFKSPIRFIPIKENNSNNYQVFIETIPIPDKYLKTTFIIESSKGGEIYLPIGNLLNFNMLIDWILSPGNFDITTHLNISHQSGNEFQILKNVFSTLRKA